MMNSKVTLALLCILCSLKALPCNITLSASSNSICLGASVTLTVSGAPNYSWQPISSTDSVITVSPIATTTYTVIGSGPGCADTASITIVVNNLPSVTTTIQYDTVCQGIPSALTGFGASQYSWQPGGFQGTVFNATPNSSTTYTVTGTSADGCTATATQSLVIKPAPKPLLTDIGALANFTTEFNNCGNATGLPTYNLNVNTPFVATITGYSLNWGDGTPTINGLNNASFPLSNTYTSYGVFNLVFTATYSNGCVRDTLIPVINETNPSIGCTGPGNTLGCAPIEYCFKITGYQNNTPGTYYIWDFGDGNTVTWNTVTVDSICHVYTNTSCGQPNNQFIVSVKAINACDSTTATVNGIRIFKKPSSDFTTSNSPQCINQPVNFQNTSTLAANSPNCSNQTNWQWNFGDPGSGPANISTAQYPPSHVYTSPGTYTVTLISSGGCGHDTVQKTVCIENNVVSFSANAGSLCTPSVVQLSNTSPTSLNCLTSPYTWTIIKQSSTCAADSLNDFAFLGGTNDTSAAPSIRFNNQGTYLIRLSHTNSCGLVTHDTIITIKRRPEVSIVMPTTLCPLEPLNPTATTVNCATNPLTYAWSCPSATPTTSTLSNPVFSLPAGIHTLTLTVSNECGPSTTQASVTVNPLPIIQISSSAGTSLCAGNSSNLTASGASTYQWNWLGGSFSGNPLTISPASNTTYTVTGTDVNGCSATSVITITINPLPTLSIVVTPLSCIPGNDATLTINASGGTPGYSYIVNGSSQANNLFTNLGTGNYTVSVLDANQCTVSTVHTLSSPNAPGISSVALQPASCFPGSDGSLQVTVSGGTPTYQYSLTPGAGWQASPLFSNLSPGNYTVIVQDAAGCTTSSTAQINTQNGPSLNSISITNASCSPGCDGMITIFATANSTLSYQLNANAYQSAASFSSLCNGQYSVTVKDAFNCTVSTVFSILTVGSLQISMDSQKNVTCFGNGDGLIDIVATGGIGTVNYNLQPGNLTNINGLFSPLAPGLYTITATDVSGCSQTISVNISEPAPLSWASVSQTDISCYNGSNGTITTQTAGGTGSITYSLTPLGTFNSSGQFNNLSAASYTVSASDANGCSITTNVTLLQPGALTINTISSTLPTCIPGNDASITIAASGGTPGYLYSVGGPIQAGNIITALGPGNYTITVTDAQNCTATSSTSISIPNAPQITLANTTPASCFGQTNGSVSIFASGGTGSITYALQPGNQSNSSGNFGGLGAGTYTVTCTDILGCSSVTQISVAEPQEILFAPAALVTPLCHGDSNGSMTISSNGGNPPFSYQLQPQAITNSTGYFPSLSAGTYTITATDVSGCTNSTMLSITEPTLLAWTSANATNANCNGTADGSLLVQGGGGTGTLTYQLLPSGPVNGTGQFSLLAAGNYTIQCSDANNCSITTSLAILQPPALLIDSISSSLASCLPSSISIFGSGGTLPYLYSLNGGPATTSNNFSNLSSGTYTATITDAQGCTAVSILNIIPPASPVFSSISHADISCFGQNNGMIFNVSATGGTAPYAYSINPGGAFSGLAPGTYTILATDANSCTAQTSVVITQPNPITTVSITTTNLSCYNTVNGSINLQCSGGSGTLQYNLQPVNQTNASGFFAGLSGNIYTVYVTDDSNCVHSVTATVQSPSALTFASFSGTPITCNGLNNGSIVTQAFGGTGSLLYTLTPALQPANGSGVFSPLPANSYTVTVTDLNNCQIDTNLILLQPPPVTGSFLIQNQVSCHGGQNGAFTVFANTGYAPFQFFLLGTPIVNTTGSFTNLTAGSYTVQIVDSAMCSSSVSPIVITEPPALQWDSLYSPVIPCFGGSTDSLKVSASGGSGILTYSINPLGPQNNNNGQFNNLTAQAYTITVKDGNNCSLTTSWQITQEPEIKWTSLLCSIPKCYGETNGQIDFSASGGTPPLLFQLNGSTPSGQTVYGNLSAGQYTLQVADAKGCQADTTITLIEPMPVLPSSCVISSVICADSSDAHITIQGTGGTGTLKYSLLPDSLTNLSGNFAQLSSGNYTLYITDSLGCYYDTLFFITPATNPLQMTISSNDLGCLGVGTEGWAQANVTGGAQPYEYLWNTNPPQVAKRATDLRFGYYVVQVYDVKGCKISDTVYINPGTCCEEVFLPNAFTPNGDGLNDIFRAVTSAGIQLIHFDIYNRWGQRLWSTDDYTKGWDGRINNAEVAEMATYYYQFTYRCLTDEKTYIKKGDVILVK